MNKLTKIAAIASLGLASMTATAGNVTVGGVTWDPDFDNGFSSDFGATSSFQQWFTAPGASTIGDQVVDQDTIDNALDAGVFPSELVGVGEFNLFNGLDTSGFLCSGCELTFAFGGIKYDNTGGVQTFDTTQSWFKIYVDTSADFVTNPGDFADAQDGQVFLSGSFDSFSLTSGSLLNGFSEALLSVTGGLAKNYFDTNTLFGSDLKLSGSANFLNNPKFSKVASADIVGDSVVVIPEPASLAIVGLGMLGLGAMSRRRKS